ncbi:hypothetical protein BRADI_4g27386v3 [Brachypodium distachyon]|uniref:Uncharacterized protein n=1 Tax=Brachypodium distachyon TaxID=15368 RepID=A0A2K2CQI9_BRADI|nr:hypothetical protein BRADI_4g27386v3 [Brachypodium distachyon]
MQISTRRSASVFVSTEGEKTVKCIFSLLLYSTPSYPK